MLVPIGVRFYNRSYRGPAPSATTPAGLDRAGLADRSSQRYWSPGVREGGGFLQGMARVRSGQAPACGQQQVQDRRGDQRGPGRRQHVRPGGHVAPRAVLARREDRDGEQPPGDQDAGASAIRAATAAVATPPAHSGPGSTQRTEPEGSGGGSCALRIGVVIGSPWLDPRVSDETDRSPLRPNRSQRSETRQRAHSCEPGTTPPEPAFLTLACVVAAAARGAGAYPTVTATEGYPLAPFGSGCSWTAVWV